MSLRQEGGGAGTEVAGGLARSVRRAPQALTVLVLVAGKQGGLTALPPSALKVCPFARPSDRISSP